MQIEGSIMLILYYILKKIFQNSWPCKALYKTGSFAYMYRLLEVLNIETFHFDKPIHPFLYKNMFSIREPLITILTTGKKC